MQEIWKDISGYEGYYQISNLGRLKRIKSGRGTTANGVVNGYLNNQGYRRMRLSINDISKCIFAHRLVAEHFIPNPNNKKEVNHLNGNKDDNRVSNLEWATPSENMKHAFNTGIRTQRGSCNPRSKLSESQVLSIYSSSVNNRALSQEYGVNVCTINDIKSGRNWNHLTKHSVKP